MSYNIHKNDLINRFPTYTFDEDTSGAITTIDFKDGGTIVAHAKGMSPKDAMSKIRESMVGDASVLPCSTTTQRNALSAGDKLIGLTIVNISRSDIKEHWDGDVWLSYGVVKLTNKSGVTINDNSMCALDTSNALAVTTTTTDGDLRACIVVDGGIDDAYVTVIGSIVEINMDTTTVSIGNYVHSSATAQQGHSWATPAPGDLAIALESKGTEVGIIKAFKGAGELF